PDLMERIREARVDLGPHLAADEAFLLHRGLETLPLRMARQCATAAEVAAAMLRHPAVARVDHPSLPDHQGHALARKPFDARPEGTRYGAVVTVTRRGGRDAGTAFADGLRLATIAPSLGGTHTLVSHVASTTHRQMSDEALRAAGIEPGAVRFSIGLEDPEDLVADALQALDE